MGQLIAGVAHEINNPVNFICGNLSMLQSTPKTCCNCCKTIKLL
ncbi:hypothetical protein CBP28_08405 [Fischerella thermalis WC559]|nr:histidine kinase dimerization/phospho-acceptor domain-containing protein [Fischerella thermalis]PLZ30189.1 hypothetical protein CBP28_08405 [Fischerella thermalis WC559]PLZ32316.1 hypothetical protein CBP10_09975 [Fischerella thermalis WC558]PLZ50893.1 hypothetical protein CBP15_14990 [Fischerella thermalis WC442]PLZ63217.1 hypothetical protein CBP24_01085 [Fischerella thermalis WC439]PLZ83764.1 hypothetical protein CBP20_01520 [Fischerella thermalis WC213]